MAGARISELADAVGVTTSTVRYYERIGLVPAPERTASGYRKYGAGAEARLRFIVRGKRLGLSLEQVGELLGVWDGTNCAATQEHLLRLLDEKQAEIVERAAELRTFSAQLREVQDRLVSTPAPSTCSQELDCCAPPMRDAPRLVCDMTNAPDGAEQRLDEYARLFATAFIAREHTPTGFRWRLRADKGIESWARDLAARENACCAFMQNTISVLGGEVLWDATTIDDATARSALELFYELPERVGDGLDSLRADFDAIGIPVVEQS